MRTVEVALAALVVFLVVTHLAAKFTGSSIGVGGAS